MRNEYTTLQLLQLFFLCPLAIFSSSKLFFSKMILYRNLPKSIDRKTEKPEKDSVERSNIIGKVKQFKMIFNFFSLRYTRDGKNFAKKTFCEENIIDKLILDMLPKISIISA